MSALFVNMKNYNGLTEETAAFKTLQLSVMF